MTALLAENNLSDLDDKAASRLVLKVPIYVYSLADLKALDPSKDKAAFLQLTSPGSGEFMWVTGDFTSRVAADPRSGMYVPANSVSASSGCWVRIRNGLSIHVDWFYPVKNGFRTSDGNGNDSPAINAAIAFARTQPFGSTVVFDSFATYVAGTPLAVEHVFDVYSRNVTLDGCGTNITTTLTFSGYLWTVGQSAPVWSYPITMRNFRFLGIYQNANLNFMQLKNANGFRLESVQVDSFNKVFDINSSYTVAFVDVFVTQCNASTFTLNSSAMQLTLTHVKVYSSNTVTANAVIDIKAANANLTLSQCDFEGGYHAI